MHNQHILQCIMQRVVSVVYIVICRPNIVRLIVGKVTLSLRNVQLHHIRRMMQ